MKLDPEQCCLSPINIHSTARLPLCGEIKDRVAGVNVNTRCPKISEYDKYYVKFPTEEKNLLLQIPEFVYLFRMCIENALNRN